MTPMLTFCVFPPTSDRSGVPLIVTPVRFSFESAPTVNQPSGHSPVPVQLSCFPSEDRPEDPAVGFPAEVKAGFPAASSHPSTPLSGGRIFLSLTLTSQGRSFITVMLTSMSCCCPSTIFSGSTSSVTLIGGQAEMEVPFIAYLRTTLSPGWSSVMWTQYISLGVPYPLAG